jgi:hypothetical protein
MIHAEGWPDGARHCLRIGAMSDKKVIEATKDSFDVLVLQGNLAVSAPQGLGSWLQLDKPFWIDPITYAFAADPTYLQARKDRGTPGSYKRTFVRLAEAFGEPFNIPLEQHVPLAPSNFSPELIRGSAERIISFQRNILQPPQEDTKYGISEKLEPALITVPFFPLQPASERPAWLDINLAFAAAATEYAEPSRLAAAMLVEPDLVDDWPMFEASFNAYLDYLPELKIEHLWLWVSENDETHMSAPRAQRILSIINEAAERGISVHQAFAGSFSTFALSRGLKSISHGVNYWEHKSWQPLASGGLPVARYFFPPLRERLRVPDAIAMIDGDVETPESFRQSVCNCATCASVVTNDIADFGRFGEVTIKRRGTRGGGTAEFDSPTAEALYLTKTHYLRAKGIEVASAITEGFDPSAILRANATQHASDMTRTSHLETWARAFDSDAG